jgi:hypothetical protein
MGIFDIFTGDSAKEAAAENQARLNALKAEGMGYLDAGKKGALDSLDAAVGYYTPLTQKYGAGTDLYLDALGVRGAEGNARAVDAFRTSPGYDFRVNQALDALDRRAASRGMLASGNTTLDTLGTVHGLADQEYDQWLAGLSGLISPELAATGGAANYTAAKAPVYTNDAAQRVALAGGVTSGLNSQTTQAANAEMAGSGNLWNLGLNLAKLGVSAATGGMGGGGITPMQANIGYGSSPSGWVGNTGYPGWVQA